MHVDPITEQDLAYYIDGHLSDARRVEVETHLARHPEQAAEVMDDLRSTHELRLVMAQGAVPIRPHTSDRARKLESALYRRQFLHRLRPVLAASLLLAIGVVGGSLLAQRSGEGEIAGHLEAALQAHSISKIRAVMVSQLEAPEYDRDELLSATAIVMPELPADWDVTDVQVYPSRFGPSVEMAIDAGDLGRTSLFAARPGQFTVAPPTVERHGETTLGHWQVGEIAYVLVGISEEDVVRAAADALFETLY